MESSRPPSSVVVISSAAPPLQAQLVPQLLGDGQGAFFAQLLLCVHPHTSFVFFLTLRLSGLVTVAPKGSRIKAGPGPL